MARGRQHPTGLVAVLMPYKQAAAYVAKAVDSLLAQTYGDFRLLAIDDGSRDGSTEIIRSFRDDRITVLRSEGHGISAALNTGLRACPECTFVARQDADDMSHPDRFARQVAFLSTHPEVAVLATQAEFIDVDGAFLCTYTTPCSCEEIRAAMKTGNPIVAGSVMFRPEHIRAVGGYDEQYPVAQAYALWVRLAGRGHVFRALPQWLYRYRSYQGSWSKTQIALRDRLLEQIRQEAIRAL